MSDPQRESHLTVCFTPADFEALAQTDLRTTTCVVFDVLRATSSMLAALDQGAAAILPVATIEEALACRRKDPEVLLGGERNGVRIGAGQAGGVDFDFGNSPREFTADRVRQRQIVMTTTNGTRALRACIGAEQVLVGALLNLEALAVRLRHEPPQRLTLVCSGTFEGAALEDALAAGALCECLWAIYQEGQVADSAETARRLYRAAEPQFQMVFCRARNARRLLSNPDLREDVAFCLRRDVLDFVATLDQAGRVTRE